MRNYSSTSIQGSIHSHFLTKKKLKNFAARLVMPSPVGRLEISNRQGVSLNLKLMWFWVWESMDQMAAVFSTIARKEKSQLMTVHTIANTKQQFPHWRSKWHPETKTPYVLWFNTEILWVWKLLWNDDQHGDWQQSKKSIQPCTHITF